MDGAEELSPHLPHVLHPFLFALILSILLLTAFINKGPPRTTPFHSVIQLILYDSYTYMLLLLSFILFLVSLIYSPRDNVSMSLLGPFFFVLAVLVYVKKTQPVRRHLYALWIAAEIMCFVHDVHIDLYSLQHLENQCSRPRVVFASRKILAKEPILTALSCFQYLHSPSSDSFPSVSLQVLKPRQTHTNRETSNQYPQKYDSTSHQKVRLLILYTTTRRINPHQRFGALWHRVTNQTCINRDVNGAWFIGCEIIQSLKHSLALTFISNNNYCDEVSSLWRWAANHDLSFRKRLQIAPVAEQLARENGYDIDIVTNLATAIAGEGRSGLLKPDDPIKQIAVEANFVAVLGIVLQKVYLNLNIEQLWQRIMVLFRNDIWLNEQVAIRSVQTWPQREIGEIVIRWVVDASHVPLEP